MIDSNEWATRIRTFLSDAEHSGNVPIHREAFKNFVAVEEPCTWDDFQHLVTSRFLGDRWAFRGHADSRWRLETSLERAVLRYRKAAPDQPPIESYVVSHPNKFERRLIYEFQQRAHHYVADPPAERDLLEWFALMQHHGLPTRLLDWTFSPYVAAYFAVEGRIPHESFADRKSVV